MPIFIHSIIITLSQSSLTNTHYIWTSLFIVVFFQSLVLFLHLSFSSSSSRRKITELLINPFYAMATSFHLVSWTRTHTQRMSLSCLACKKLRRVNSDLALEPLNPSSGRPRLTGHRNLSGCLAWPPNHRTGLHCRPLVPRDARRPLRRVPSSSAASNCMKVACGAAAKGPQLRRSSGMRRDWSFEDLKKDVMAVST